MQKLAVCVVAVVLAIGGDDVSQAIKKDKAALQGTWKVTASVSKGEKSTAEEIKDLQLIFRDNAIHIREEGKTQENFSFLLDPIKKPKEIDLTIKVGEQKGRVDRGIYQIDGDTLRICIQTDKDAARPSAFASPAGSKLWLIILQRTKN